MKAAVPCAGFVLILCGCAGTGLPIGTAVAGGAGAAAGAALGKGSVAAAAAGAVVGGGLAAFSAGRERTAYARGVGDGYALGSSDAVKRLYWAEQAKERPSADKTGYDLLRKLLEENAR